jgi:hypothetical protein
LKTISYAIRHYLTTRLVELKYFLHLLSGLLLLATATPSFSVEPATNVYFAGFALAGNGEQTEKAFPITTKLLKEQSAKDGAFLLESELWKHVNSSSHPYIKLNRGLASGLVPGDSVSMAFMLEWENVSSETVAGKIKMVADLHGQILIFDFDSKKVIGSYPVAAQLIHVFYGPATEEIRAKLIRGLYYGSAGNSIFGQVAKRLPVVSVKPSIGNFIQIVAVDLEPKAHQTLSQYHADPRVLVSRVADAFGERLFENANVAYIPFTKGTAIGSKMAARFASGEVFQLELPAPDYRIHLRVRGYKKMLLDSNNIQSAWGYASYINVAIKSYDDSKVYLDSPFKYVVTKNVIAGTSDQDDWSAFQESMFTLIDQTTLQIAKPDSDWLDEWSGGDNTLEELESFSGILERTR